MREFSTSGLAMLLRQLVDARAYSARMSQAGFRDKEVPEKGLSEVVLPLISATRDIALQAELSSTLDRVADATGYFHRAASEKMTFQDLQHQLAVLQETIEADLQKRHFVFVPSEKAKVFKDMPSLWKVIWSKLPECKTDAEEAIFCYCLERNTASVFHSMRVSEYGLRNIAKRVGVKLSDKGKRQPVDSATWGKVLDGIGKRLASVRALPQGPIRKNRLLFYSDVAENCTFIRDIWRNEVSHTGKGYTDGEALQVLNRVRDFMILLLEGPARGQ